MTDFRGVIVIGSARDGSDINVGKHTDANTIEVSNGHLVVKLGAKVVAIYAPGAWKNAQVLD